MLTALQKTKLGIASGNSLKTGEGRDIRQPALEKTLLFSCSIESDSLQRYGHGLQHASPRWSDFLRVQENMANWVVFGWSLMGFGKVVVESGGREKGRSTLSESGKRCLLPP